MTREEFDALVHRIQNGVGRRPKALRLRVGLLAAIGYGGLLAPLAAMLALACFLLVVASFGDMAVKIFFSLLALLALIAGSWSILRVLWVRLSPPEGCAITRSNAPALHGLLDEMRGRLRSAPFHDVLLVPQCNASVVQVPRLGVLGWYRNYLLIGFPLLEGLSLDELRAVLAHESAHLSRQNGRFSHWIYRLRRSWEKVFEQLSCPRVEGEVSLRPLVTKFINWFWPRFNAYAFVLSRADEYEADAVAAQLAGAGNVGSSLFRLAVYDRHINENFWPNLWELANSQSTPPAGVFGRLRDSLRLESSAADVRNWVEQAFRITTTNADTHPALVDRLRAVDRLPATLAPDQFPPLPPFPSPTAAEALLGSSFEGICHDLEQHWREKSHRVWQDRHARAGALHHRLERLDAVASGGSADVDTIWDKACVLLDLHSDKAAEPLLREILSLQPAHVGANFQLGRLLINAGHDTAEAYLERAMAEDEQLVPPACDLLHAHYRRQGRADRLRELAARLDRYEKELAASQAERSTVTAADPLVGHELSGEELSALRERLSAEAELASAHLARKALRYFPKQAFFLLCVRRRPSWHRLPDRDRDRALVNRLSQTVRLSGRVLVFSPSGSFRALARKLRQVPGARIFLRGM